MVIAKKPSHFGERDEKAVGGEEKTFALCKKIIYMAQKVFSLALKSSLPCHKQVRNDMVY
jgi:hypothetical protein